MFRRITTAALVFASAACGGDEPVQGPPVSTPASSGAEATAPSPQHRGERSENLSALAGVPNVSVFVEGPTRTSTDAVSAGGHADFETVVRVVNDGDADLTIDELYVRFETWSADGERTACFNANEPDPPEEAEEDDSVMHRVRASCPFGAAGTFEVRSYVSFEATELEGDFDVERHYAGRTEVTIGR